MPSGSGIWQSIEPVQPPPRFLPRNPHPNECRGAAGNHLADSPRPKQSRDLHSLNTHQPPRLNLTIIALPAGGTASSARPQLAVSYQDTLAEYQQKTSNHQTTKHQKELNAEPKKEHQKINTKTKTNPTTKWTAYHRTTTALTRASAHRYTPSPSPSRSSSFPPSSSSSPP
jgi:hypothetical protein